MIGHEPCASRGDCYHIRIGHIGGRIQGRKNVESGQLARIRELPQTKAAQRESGRKAGRKYGHKNGRKYGRIGGRKNVESGHLARIASLGGRIQGRKNVESGQLARILELPQTKVAQRRVGRKAVESGRLARISKGVLSTADGILFRSQTEAMFYCVAKKLGGEPVYEPSLIKLPDGAFYIPDFVFSNPVLGLPANVPIELKPSRNTFNFRNVEKALRAGAVVVYWDELVEKP